MDDRAPEVQVARAPDRPKMGGLARVIALLAISAALLPWLVVLWLFAWGLYFELLWSTWAATYAVAALSGSGWGMVFTPIMLIGVAVLGTALFYGGGALLIYGKLFAAAWTGVAAGDADLAVLRGCAVANAATAGIWGLIYWNVEALEVREPTSVLAAVAAAAAALAVLAVVLAKREQGMKPRA